MKQTKATKETRDERARARLFSKLPCAAKTLTMPEISQLRPMELAGLIEYDQTSGRWDRASRTLLISRPGERPVRASYVPDTLAPSDADLRAYAARYLDDPLPDGTTVTLVNAGRCNG